MKSEGYLRPQERWAETSLVFPKIAEKYFDVYAAEESLPAESCSKGFRKVWDRVVVIPAWRESESLFQTLESLQASARDLKLSLLVILVLNGKPEERDARLKIARRLLSDDRTFGAISGLVDLEIIFVERPSVGYARKVGMDLASRLFFLERLRSPWLRTTDADVTAPLDYLQDYIVQPKNENEVERRGLGQNTFSAEIYSFEHTYDKLEPRAAEAHRIYDYFLRYYVAGLEYAHSPYAFHNIGSLLNIHAHSYVEVRGFPDREAGEDFYILNKLAKVGGVVTRTKGASPVSIEGRLSDRVPFGTGRGVAKILDQLCTAFTTSFYDPDIFVELRRWLMALEKFSTTKDEDKFFESLSNPLKSFWMAHELTKEIRKLPLHSKNPKNRCIQVHTWFDSFRTLKFVHWMRDHIYPSLSWKTAIEKSRSIDNWPEVR